jgi:hypothetical protein
MNYIQWIASSGVVPELLLTHDLSGVHFRLYFMLLAMEVAIGANWLAGTGMRSEALTLIFRRQSYKRVSLAVW